jgi:16S rRNA (cytosine967-C5)-methyltransferase
MDELNENLSFDAIYSHPAWMIGKIKKHYPAQLEDILDANNQHPPFSLRVNQQRISREDYLEKLVADGLSAQSIPETLSGIILEEAIDVLQLPGFSEGEVSVQDGAAQLAAELLELAPEQHVLDACAAPGGKTAHILELQPTVTCVAVDHDPERLASVTENLERLNLSATCIAADVAETDKWWDGKLFDRILLDAPCSASGVIRRHPDIKLLRRPTDIPALAKIQLELLEAVWSLLKPGGLLLYATCSVFVDENVQVLKSFLTLHPEINEEKITAPWGVECDIGKQILPGSHNMDGFYFARLRK